VLYLQIRTALFNYKFNKTHKSVGLDIWVVIFLYEWDCKCWMRYCYMCALAVKICAVDTMFTPSFRTRFVFLGCCVVNVMVRGILFMLVLIDV
jgi:hypothetical protein